MQITIKIKLNPILFKNYKIKGYIHKIKNNCNN